MSKPAIIERLEAASRYYDVVREAEAEDLRPVYGPPRPPKRVATERELNEWM